MVPGRQRYPAAGNRSPPISKQLAGAHIEEDASFTAEGRPAKNAVRGDDLAAGERREVRGERIPDGARSATREWPARRVAQHAEHEPERRAEGGFERNHRVGRDASKQCTRAFAAEAGLGEPARGPHAVPAEAGEGDWVSRRKERCEHPFEQRVSVGDQRSKEALVYARWSGPKSGEAVSASDVWRSAAEPSSNGCASGAGGWIHSRPKSASGSERKTGEARPSG